MQPETATLALLVRRQRPDGSFAIAAKGRPNGVAPLSADLALHALLLDLLLGNPAADAVTLRLAEHLTKALRLAELNTVLETTDTGAVFHALAALYEYDARRLTTDNLATSVRFLTEHELAAGGPYLNALTDGHTPDVATNVSIGRFIHLVAEPLPKLLAYIDRADKQAAGSPYFTADWVSQLQLARLRAASGVAEDNTDPTSHPWRLVAGPRRAGQRYLYIDLWRSPTAAYGMAAITLARTLPEPAGPSGAAAKDVSAQQAAVYRRILDRALADNQSDPLIAKAIATMLNRTANADHSREIGLLATRFAPAVHARRPSRQTFELLGAANLYNWAAYTVYDDIQDGENNGAVDLLPAANTALRTAAQLFAAAVPDDAFRRTVNAAFDTVDAANAWELAHCRFVVRDGTVAIDTPPDYGDLCNLYERSLTHSLPVMGTLAAAGIAPSSDTAQTIFRAFKQYLVIKQLSDDLHDWQADLRSGHCSYVVTCALADAGVVAGCWSPDALVAQLERTFLRHTLPALGIGILDRAGRAHALLEQAAGIDSPNVIDTLIDGIEQSTRHMLTEYERVYSLIKAYRV